MRKLLCLLICAMLLCSGAHAEAFRGQITWEADARGALDYLTATSEEDPKQLEKLADAMAELSSGLDVSFGWQNNGLYGAVSLKDTLLLDMAIFVEGEQGVIMSNLLPGHYMSISAPLEDTMASQAASKQLEELDWSALALDAMDCLEAWLAGLATTEEHGSFMGDAYQGGTYRKTFTFDDKNVAELVAGLTDELGKHGINDALLEDYLGESSLISNFLRINQQAGEENRYNYVLREVYGLNEAPIGYSLIVHEGDVQVMTLSLATAENGWRIVWGYGLNGLNYYIGAECIREAEETFFNLMMYQDPMRAGYLPVEPFAENILMMVEGKLTTRENGWHAEVEVLDPMAAIIDTYYVLDCETYADGGSKLMLDWYLSGENGRAETPMQKSTFTIEPCEPKVWSVEELTDIPMDNGGDQELIDSLVEEALQDLMVNLFKLVPTQMLTMLLPI